MIDVVTTLEVLRVPETFEVPKLLEVSITTDFSLYHTTVSLSTP